MEGLSDWSKVKNYEIVSKKDSFVERENKRRKKDILFVGVGFVILFPYIFSPSRTSCCYICGLLQLGSGKKKDSEIFHGSSFS
jgi:hypothetical protein